MKRLLLGTILGLASCLPAVAQGRWTVSGTVRDKATGEVLIGASVSLLEVTRSGVLSNSYGFFSITAPAGRCSLLVSFSGYLTDTLPVMLYKNVMVSEELQPADVQLAAVVVSAQKKNDNITRPVMAGQRVSFILTRIFVQDTAAKIAANRQGQENGVVGE